MAPALLSANSQPGNRVVWRDATGNGLVGQFAHAERGGASRSSSGARLADMREQRITGTGGFDGVRW